MILDDFRLDGDVALVTGASRGLGRAMAVALGEAGASVALTARSEAGLDETAALVREAGLRYVSSQAWGPHFTLPAPLADAYSYSEEGYADIWEFPCHGWHENVLKGHNATPGRLLLWPPLYPEQMLTGYVTTPVEEFAIHRWFIDRAIAEGREYVSLIWHPWSLGRFDPEMTMPDMLFSYAKSRGMPFLRHADLWKRRA